MSYVDTKNEYLASSLFVGDRLISVNNFNISRVKLIDFFNFTKRHSILVLKVSNFAMLPVRLSRSIKTESLNSEECLKEPPVEPSFWSFTENGNVASQNPVHNVQVHLKNGFGCRLYKKASEQTIHVDNVVPFSVAHEVGIRERDQLLFVNGVKFHGISRAEAILAFNRKSPVTLSFCSSVTPEVQIVPPKCPPDILKSLQSSTQKFNVIVGLPGRPAAEVENILTRGQMNELDPSDGKK